MKRKENNWTDVIIKIDGVVLEGVSSITYIPSLDELNTSLHTAEQNEDYELCSEIKKQIDKYYKAKL